MSRQLCKTAPLVQRFSPRADLTHCLNGCLTDWLSDWLSECASDRHLLEFMRHVARTMQPATCVCACWWCCHSGCCRCCDCCCCLPAMVNYLCQLDIYLASSRPTKPRVLSRLWALSFALHAVCSAWAFFRAYFSGAFRINCSGVEFWADLGCNLHICKCKYSWTLSRKLELILTIDIYSFQPRKGHPGVIFLRVFLGKDYILKKSF